MQTGTERAGRAAGVRVLRVAIAAAFAFMLANCGGEGQPALLMQAQLRGPTIAFESIDGPPLPIFQKLVANLSNEAEQHRILVVSRASQPAYRVRGYVAALMTQGHTHIGWVWDVYDAQKRRAFRIAGEETFPGKTSDAWRLLDDAMVSRITRTSMDQIVGFLGAPDIAVADAGPPPLPTAFAAASIPALPAAFQE